MSQTGTFAFLVHPRARLSEDMARVSKPLGLRARARLRRRAAPPARAAGDDGLGPPRRDAGRATSSSSPSAPATCSPSPREARDRVARAVDHAGGLGATVVGLGALTATVTGGGVSLRSRTDIGVTNGNAFTAAIVDDQVRGAARAAPAVGPARRRRRRHRQRRHGRHPAARPRRRGRRRLTLVARNEPAASTRCAADVSGRGVDRRLDHDLHAVAHADLVILLTASADCAARAAAPRARAPSCSTRPSRATPRPSCARERPDVLVLDGGVVSIPSLRARRRQHRPARRPRLCLLRRDRAPRPVRAPGPLLHRRPVLELVDLHPGARRRPLAPRLPRRRADDLRRAGRPSPSPRRWRSDRDGRRDRRAVA